jgi:hypothetical protein
MQRASHQKRCRVCGGTGWMPGPAIPGHHQGKAFEYGTQQPCTHPYWQDDETVDEYGFDTVIPITFQQYLDRVRARGDIAELARWERWRERKAA